MNPIVAQLLASAPVITDGAWGTQLQAAGLQPGECPDALNLSHPEWVSRVARTYVDAGSNVILTNTFRANRLALASYGLEAKVREINRAGVALSKQAAGGRARVFASMGPSGKMMMTGEVEEDDLLAAFTEQASVLAEAGADALLLETMSDLTEATIALEAARTTGLPVAVSLVFDSGKEKDRTMMGQTPEQVAKALADGGAEIIGANCGLGIEGYIPVCRRLHAATDRPLWIKPNAGLPVLSAGRVTYATTPAEFARHVPALLAAGASFIGGCCGTTPEFIAAVSALRTSAGQGKH
jgi:5-methyltetrahydrofolate--homocysteine methyltransferase